MARTTSKSINVISRIIETFIPAFRILLSLDMVFRMSVFTPSPQSSPLEGEDINIPWIEVRV
jgi:hypothetical protein